MRKLEIDPEFRAQIPPATPEELAELERDILEHGIRDSLVAWRGVLLDGHQRYEIAQRHKLLFQVLEYEFPDRRAAADWIDRNQLGRRNLTPDQMSLIRGRRYNRVKHRGERTDLTSTTNQKRFGKAGRAAVLGKEHAVSKNTIVQDGHFAAAVEALKPLVPDIEQRVISGKGPPRETVRAAAALIASDPAKAVAFLETPPARKRLRRLPGKPIAERLQRAVAGIVSAIEVASEVDFSPLVGTPEAGAAAAELRRVAPVLRRMRLRLEGQA